MSMHDKGKPVKSLGVCIVVNFALDLSVRLHLQCTYNIKNPEINKGDTMEMQAKIIFTRRIGNTRLIDTVSLKDAINRSDLYPHFKYDLPTFSDYDRFIGQRLIQDFAKDRLDPKVTVKIGHGKNRQTVTLAWDRCDF